MKRKYKTDKDPNAVKQNTCHVSITLGERTISNTVGEHVVAAVIKGEETHVVASGKMTYHQALTCAGLIIETVSQQLILGGAPVQSVGSVFARAFASGAEKARSKGEEGDIDG